ncbi:hypothetical protein [Streptomyces sp. HUAS TT7]|uniref:hypothetical protein n=1 Tax=Streptomyces sp. HUAS TT7 TaxID=3447507 RepID=UPI003F6576D8
MTNLSVLFHYTSRASWELISSARKIEPLSYAADHMDGEFPLIWLTDSLEATDSGIADPSRGEIRIAVRPRAGIFYWPVWGKLCPNQERMDCWGDPASWYVARDQIASSDWQEVVDQTAQAQLYSDGKTPAEVSAWGSAPNAADLNRIRMSLERAQKTQEAQIQAASAEAGWDLFRAQRVGLQVEEIETLMRTESGGQRLRAGWRSLLDEVTALPGYTDVRGTGTV